MSPFGKNPRETVSALGEERLIAAIRTWLGNATPPAPRGIGDDCAVLPPAKTLQAITVDPVIYGRHFDENISPEAVGAKLLKRNLSDLAAMGARPTAAVIALTLDPRVRTRWLENFYRGLAKTARAFAVPIVGGDVAQANGVLAASLTLLGQATGKRLVPRRGARAGDWIYVTGSLGGSLSGHHHKFTPRLTEGAWLATRSDVRSMMDVSDGLAKDLKSLTPDGCKPTLAAASMPISAAAKAVARKTGRSPLEHALCDGEDYELVFSLVKNADRAAFEQSWHRRFRTRLTCIGYFSGSKKLPADAIDLDAYHGYEHLARAKVKRTP